MSQYVAGAVIVNDYSARDIQIPQMQFYKGKSYRSFGPVGPYLCLLGMADFDVLRRLQLKLSVNGQPRQEDTTANLVFGPAETLTELSTIQELFCGDLLATGTPSGCAHCAYRRYPWSNCSAYCRNGTKVAFVHQGAVAPRRVSPAMEMSLNRVS